MSTEAPLISLEAVTFTVGSHVLYSNLDKFPRDQHGNFVCVYRGCPVMILRINDVTTYLRHLGDHAVAGDTPLPCMFHHSDSNLLAVLSALGPGVQSIPMASTSPMMSPHSPFSSPAPSPGSESLPPTPRTASPPARSPTPGNLLEEHAEEYTVVGGVKPSPRAHQLNAQMAKYGSHLFRRDRNGCFVCFFQDCHRRMSNNFSRHIKKHEKMGDMVDSRLCRRPRMSSDYRDEAQLSPPSLTLTPCSLPVAQLVVPEEYGNGTCDDLSVPVDALLEAAALAGRNRNRCSPY